MAGGPRQKRYKRIIKRPQNKDWFCTNVSWSFSTPLACNMPSWKNYEIDLYLAEYIVTLRMRGYMMDNPDYRIHFVMTNNQEAISPA